MKKKNEIKKLVNLLDSSLLKCSEVMTPKWCKMQVLLLSVKVFFFFFNSTPFEFIRKASCESWNSLYYWKALLKGIQSISTLCSFWQVYWLEWRLFASSMNCAISPLICVPEGKYVVYVAFRNVRFDCALAYDFCFNPGHENISKRVCHLRFHGGFMCLEMILCIKNHLVKLGSGVGCAILNTTTSMSR